MKDRLRTTLIYVLSALIIITLFTATLTSGRYSGEYSSDGRYDGDMDYVVSNQVKISSVEEFFAAIENGYGNIIIADEMDNPLIISGGVNDIHSDLVIDLNGHEIQRNNKQPLLNLTQGVRLTIIDTSEQGGGSFYNPVGGVLQVSGGTLTVSAGLFESGPRNGEGASASEYAYYSDADGRWHTDFNACTYGDTFVDLTDSTGQTTYVSMPVIVPGVELGNTGGADNKTVNGNMYFTSRYDDNAYIGADTYLYFTLNDKTVQNATITEKGSADYFYCYYLKKQADGTYSFDAQSQTEADDNIKITVYVYNDVKGGATDTGMSFSAINMQSGNLYVRGGEYQSYFGLDATYCVNASGGYMAVESGGFYAFEEGVCINCDYEGKDEQNEYLRVSNGSFYSEKGDTIRVSEGRMLVSGGKFVKNANDVGSAYGQNNSVINMNGGSLTVGSELTSAEFSIYGDGINGIFADSGAGVQVYNADFEFSSAQSYASQSGENSVNYVRGIYSGGGKVTCNGYTHIVIGNCGTSASEGKFNIGIHAEGGQVECKGNTTIEVCPTEGNILGRNNYGIFADGGTVACEGSTEVAVCGSLSTGIYANSGNVVIGGNGAIADEFRCSVLMPANKVLSSTAISTIGGDITFYADTAEISSNGLGVTVGGGNITFAEEVENVKLTTARGTAIYIYGGSLELSGASTVLDVVSTIEDGTSWTVDTSEGSEGATDTGVSIYNGIYIQGGSLNSKGILKVDHTGIANTKGGSDMIKSYAVRVEGTQTAAARVAMASGTIENSVGGGIYVKGGSIAAGTSTGTTTITSEGYAIAMRGNAAEDKAIISGNIDIQTSKTTAIYITGGSLTFNEGSVADISSEINSAYTFCNDTDTVSYDGIYINEGSLIADGTLNVTHKGLNNDTINSGENTGLTGKNAYRDFNIKSYAVRVAGTDNTQVRITNGTITNSSGGGVYVSGGTVEMGAQSGTSALAVSATGSGVYDTFYQIDGAANNWSYKLPSSGGPAVKVNGGQLDVYDGTYSSAQGDGIVIKNGTVNVYGGTFIGADTYEGNDYYDKTVCGPAASYCLKVYGGTANIYGGIFGDDKTVTSSSINSSGAFVMGTSQQQKGVANIYGGVFNVAGQAAFSIYQYAAVTFGEENGSSDIYLRGFAAGLTIEETKSNSVHVDTQMTITINGGEFRGYRSSGGDGIWTGNVYADILINGGQFFGETRNGLNVGGGTVKIHGGKFYGYNANAISGSYSALNATSATGTEVVGGKSYNVVTFTPY